MTISVQEIEQQQPDRDCMSSEHALRLFLMTDSFETGGSERQFVQLANALDRNRCHLQLGCLQKRGTFLKDVGDVKEFPLGGSLYGWRSITSRLRLARYLRKSRVSVAYAFDFYSNLALIPAAKFAAVPVVIGSQRQLGNLLSSARAHAQLAVLRWCDCIVCNSQAARKLVVERGVPEDKVVVIGNGLPPSSFAPATPALPRNRRLRVGMIARMNTPSKKHSVLLKAAAHLRGTFPEIEFVFAGDGPLRAQFDREAEQLGIAGQVLFLGDRHDIRSILASIDISVLPSGSESLSNAILESMAAGVPVIATDVGGNPELLGDGRGMLIPLDDPKALADAIAQLLRNASMRLELSRKAKTFAESNFTIAQMRKRHEELYSELLGRKTQPKKARSFQHQNDSRRLPLKVAIVAASPRYVGGQSVQATMLASNWSSNSSVEACLIPIDPRFPRGLKWAESIPFLRTLIREPIYLARLWKEVKHVDILHIFAASYWSFLIAPAPAWLMAHSSGKKALIHYHSGEAFQHLRRSGLARFVLRKADQIVVPSQYLVEVFREFGLSAQAVPNIVNISQFRFRERRPLRPHLVCTRGFHQYYRVDLVLQAFAKVQKEFPDAQLDLVGQGPQEEEMRKLVQRLHIENVNFGGVATHDDIGRFYDAADIFINASSVDNMPVSILEAFACGLPVVSTAAGGIRHLVEHERTGLLTEPENAEGLAQNVLRLLRDSNLSSQITTHAYEECKQYEWAAVREQWLELYRQLGAQACEASRGLASVA